MAQTQTVTVVRTCDQCGRTVSLVQPVTKQQLDAASGWFTVVKEHVIGVELAPLHKHACSKLCAVQLIEGDALELPQEILDNRKGNVLEFNKVN